MTEPTREDVLNHPSHQSYPMDDEVRFWLPSFDCRGNQTRKPWWDRKIIHMATIDNQKVGFWEWESGVRDHA